ncbi:MAG: four helix bundle protein [Ignavibacteriae bacterium]|nr:four helix bundle protein [Ignavibacteriota bacterium]
MTEKKTYNFEDLDVWKEGRLLRIEIEKLSNRFPADEKYNLKSQMIRASRSITNNIAEGYGRFHYQEIIQFCRQGRGSAYELMDDLIICKDNDFIKDDEYTELKNRCNTVIKLLNGYINFLKKQKEMEK